MFAEEPIAAGTEVSFNGDCGKRCVGSTSAMRTNDLKRVAGSDSKRKEENRVLLTWGTEWID